MTVPAHFWIGFHLIVGALLAFDLLVYRRDARSVSIREAAVWTGIWIVFSLLFGAGVWLVMGSQKGIEFFTGYVIEYALSTDNIFVFVLILSYFAVPARDQHRVLFWGILGAILLRGSMILMGAVLVKRFSWILYFFGAFLVYTGIRMARSGDEEIKPDENPVFRLARKLFRVTDSYEGPAFWVCRQGKIWLTPLMLVLIVVDWIDLIFAVDSIPAIFAVTQDSFIVYTSNICAIFGLRSLYFLLAGAMNQFAYLKIGLSVILVFIGAKMLLAHVVPIPTGGSLLVVLTILAVAVGASLWRKRERS